MLLHLVCFKYRSDVDAATRQQHRDRLAALKALDGVIDLKVGSDVVRSPRSYDTGLAITFPDRAALDAYQKNERHVPIAQFGVTISEHIVAVDFEIEHCALRANPDIKLSALPSVYAGEMLIAATAAAVLVASSLAAGAAAPATYPALPPMVVNVTVAETISPSLVALTIGEADAIFRSAGVSFIWRYGPPALTALTVAIGDDTGSLRRDDVTALGWIVFEDGRPDQQIYLSYANAEKFMLDARAVVGLPNNMPRAERELLLGRAMGRALAHELGHYLLATKVHSDRGLMKAVRSAQEFFAPERVRFGLDRLQQLQIATRLRGDDAVASHRKPDRDRSPGGTNQ